MPLVVYCVYRVDPFKIFYTKKIKKITNMSNYY